MSLFMNLVKAARVAACLLALSLMSSGCSLTEAGLPHTLDDVGDMTREEGIVFGSLSVVVDYSANLVGDWGSLDYSIPGPGEDAVYSLVIFEVGRTGVPRTDRSWEARCTIDKVCPFVAKFTEGSYVASTIRIAQPKDDEFMLQFGEILTRVDYRFTVTPGEIRYLGRLEVSPPVYDEEGEAELPIEVLDAASADSEAVGVAGDQRVVTALLDGDYRGRPTASFLTTR